MRQEEEGVRFRLPYPEVGPPFDAILSTWQWCELPKGLRDLVCREFCCNGVDSIEYRAARAATVAYAAERWGGDDE